MEFRMLDAVKFLLGTDRRAGTAMEYGLIIAATALVGFAAIRPIGARLAAIFSQAGQ